MVAPGSLLIGVQLGAASNAASGIAGRAIVAGAQERTWRCCRWLTSVVTGKGVTGLVEWPAGGRR